MYKNLKLTKPITILNIDIGNHINALYERKDVHGR